MRVSSGQHSIWCDIPLGRKKTEGEKEREKEKGNEKIKSGSISNPKPSRNPKTDPNPKLNHKPNPWNYTKACLKNIKQRVDKSTPLNDIFALLPTPLSMPKRPRFCSSKVLIDHYKWVTGVELHLFKVS